MKKLRCDYGGLGFDKVIKSAADAISKGGLVVYPTDTVYGLGADIFNPVAVKNVYMAKNRPFDMPLTVAVSDLKMMEEVAEVCEMAEKLIREFMPGPLTLVLKRRGSVQDIVTSGTDTVGVRIPDHPVAVGMARIAGPITATSANVHSHPDATDLWSAMDDLGDSVDLYIDSGPSRIKKPSTIVLLEDGEMSILRKGAIPADDISEALNA
jgi:L-threonylcarbamoyladenylate synthase